MHVANGIDQFICITLTPYMTYDHDTYSMTQFYHHKTGLKRNKYVETLFL